MRSGFDHNVGNDDSVQLSVRRCYSDEPNTEEGIELTVETFNGGWFMSTVFLTIPQALDISRDLLTEATNALGPQEVCYT